MEEERSEERERKREKKVEFHEGKRLPVTAVKSLQFLSQMHFKQMNVHRFLFEKMRKWPSDALCCIELDLFNYFSVLISHFRYFPASPFIHILAKAIVCQSFCMKLFMNKAMCIDSNDKSTTDQIV